MTLVMPRQRQETERTARRRLTSSTQPDEERPVKKSRLQRYGSVASAVLVLGLVGVPGAVAGVGDPSSTAAQSDGVGKPGIELAPTDTSSRALPEEVQTTLGIPVTVTAGLRSRLGVGAGTSEREVAERWAEYITRDLPPGDLALLRSAHYRGGVEIQADPITLRYLSVTESTDEFSIAATTATNVTTCYPATNVSCIRRSAIYYQVKISGSSGTSTGNWTSSLSIHSRTLISIRYKTSSGVWTSLPGSSSLHWAAPGLTITAVEH